jgi:hypothetical protein
LEGIKEIKGVVVRDRLALWAVAEVSTKVTF